MTPPTFRRFCKPSLRVVVALIQHCLAKSDAFIAFMGLDVRVRESGYFRGKRKLTKKGNPEMRRLLFNAARSGAKTKQWNAYYLAMRARGH